jgi:uracil-DNA glycosylase family 4
MALALDPRRRAMLEEMGIKVWWPAGDLVDPASRLAAAGAGRDGADQRREVLVARPAPAPALPQRGSEPQATRPRDGSGASFEAAPRAAGIDTMDWATLESTVAACRACGLCQRRNNAVFGIGARRADWLVLGEAPGHEEDLAGEPFVGASGQLLDNMLGAIGLRRKASAPAQPNVYIANVLKCRPPSNRNPEPHEVAQCWPYLRRQIELLEPRIILAMGRFAVNALLQGVVPEVERVPLGKLRGQAYHYQNGSKTTPVVVTYHPAYLLRNLAAKAQAWEDLCLALDVLRRQEPATVA